LLIVSTAVVNVAVNHGLGRHVAHLDPSDFSYVLYLSTIFEPLAIFSINFPKVAVMLLILDLMGPRRQGVWFLYFLIFILFLSSALACIFVFVQCNPPSHIYNPTSPAVCWSPNVLRDTTIFSGCKSACFSWSVSTKTIQAWSAFSDLCLSAYPATLFWNLQMKFKQKIGLSILMGLGILYGIPFFTLTYAKLSLFLGL
jgi:hypothetical protein